MAIIDDETGAGLLDEHAAAILDELVTVAGTLVGITVPTSAFTNPGCYATVLGLSQQQADAQACDLVGRGISSSGHLYPPVVKKFFFARDFNATHNDMVRYRSLNTYVIIVLFPITDGVKGDPSPGVWAAANPGGMYTDTTGVGGGSPVAASAAADKTSMATMLSNLAAAGWTRDNCEIVLWQEPENNLTLNQWNVMLRTYGSVVNTPHGGVTFKLCLDIGASQGANVPTWCKAGLGSVLNPTQGPWATGAVSLGMPTIDCLGLDYYLGSGFPNNLIDRQDSFQDSIISLTDQFPGMTFGLCEVGCNPSTITPLPTRHDHINDTPAGSGNGCISYMQYILSFCQARIAAGKPPRMVCWWTANCNADGTAQLSSPIGLAQHGQASLPDPDFRIGLYQGWVDGLTGAASSFTMRQSSLQFTGTAGVLSMWNSQTVPPSGGAATLNGSLLIAKIELSDCTNTTTVTGPAGWALAPHEGKAGSANSQARTQIWYYPNDPGGRYGTSGALAVFTCSNSGASIKGEMNEWTTPAATIQALDAAGGSGAIANVTSLPIQTTTANVFTSDMGEAMFGARISGGTAGQGWTAPSGWTGSGAISNIADTFQSINDSALAAGTTAVTGLFVPGGWTMSNWAGAVATFTATAAITLQDTTGPLNGGTVGAAYSDAITALGGAGPYTYALASGTLPAGVSLNTATGALTAANTTVAGTYNFHTLITDCSQQTINAAHTIIIAPGVSTLMITTGSLPSGTAGVPYPAGTVVQATGGSPPYTWTVT
jgi:hypothetical protein